MVLKLYAANRAGGGGAVVAVVLAFKRIPFEFVPTDVSAVDPSTKTPELLAMQPFGQVPFIDDDGFVLYESRAICLYLERKYPNQPEGSKLAPDVGADLRATALFNQAMSVETFNFYPFAYRVVDEVIFKPHYGGQTDSALLATALKEFESKLDVYEKILSKQRYTAGDYLSIVDLSHLSHAPLLARYAGIDVMTRSERPNVARWWKELIGFPEWREVEEQDGIRSRGV
ncbi:Glutathione S-transferase [Mycena chlorophos]|uniref:glutathione transferase n=1 Tax=Mycena chlorophos TaxID=658473 RepID=A0A8H6VTG3_MYCCL|nr:Glutathione S-transferase [Mycena chlorophos]